MKRKTNEKALQDLLNDVKGTPGSHYIRQLLLRAANRETAEFPPHLQNWDHCIKSIINNLSYEMDNKSN